MTARRCSRLAAAALALAAGAACAQSDSPWHVGLDVDATRNSNISLQPAGGEVSGTIWTTTLRGGVNALLGRQRAWGRAALGRVHYTGLDALDNQTYNLGAGLDWSTVGNLSGSLNASSDRRQAALNSGVATAALKNRQGSNVFSAKARLGGDGLLAFDAGLGHRRVNFSAVEFASRQYRQNSGNVGMSYRVGGALTVGGGVSTQRTEFLVPLAGATTPDASRRNDVYLSATWLPTGASTLTARANFGKTEYDQAAAANFEGTTGSLIWQWKPLGRLALTSTLARDSGQDLGYQPLSDGTVPNRATDFSRVTDSLTVDGLYELTGKVALTANFGLLRRELVDISTAGTGSDRTKRALIGARWSATRVITAGCTAGREVRNASGAGTYSYANDQVGCYVRATID